MQSTNLIPAIALSMGLASFVIPASSAHAASSTEHNRSIAPGGNETAQVHITLTEDNGGACVLDHRSAEAGPITFHVVNKTATAITEVELVRHNRILGEKENLAPGLPAVSFTRTLDHGTYEIHCPGAKQPSQTFEVTGNTVTRATGDVAEVLAAGTRRYARYVARQVDSMIAAVRLLAADINAGDLAKARIDYVQARPFYERIESNVEGFVLPGFTATDNAGSLDYLIDMRASNLDPGIGWHGFHAIERDLFKNGKITDATRKQAAELKENVERLDERVQSLHYQPEDIAIGAADLLEEVQSSKITGEEEAYSHYDLVDLANNVKGAQQAFLFLKPGLNKLDPELTQRVSEQFAKVDQLLDTYRDRDIAGGYLRYTAQFKAHDAARLSRRIQSLQEPLSRIAEKVASAT